MLNARVERQVGRQMVARGHGQKEALDIGPESAFALVIDDVSKSYEGFALKDVSFDLNCGETLAIVGPPGSGKSTLIRLILRLYEYETGSIRLDGRELRDLDRDSVRDQIAVVAQEAFLFSRSLADNLRVGASGASEENLLAATRDADGQWLQHRDRR